MVVEFLNRLERQAKCGLCHKRILAGQKTMNYRGKRCHSSCVVYEGKET